MSFIKIVIKNISLTYRYKHHLIDRKHATGDWMVLRTGSSNIVDRTDWLKTVAILLVAVDHIGYFFVENNDWWSVFGRFAAPVFFFLLGYAKSKRVPVTWVLLGLLLTTLDSWNNDWAWVAPNILLSLAFIRVVRPYVEAGLRKTGLLGFALLVLVLVLILPFAGEVVEYGSEGWLWALFGLIQRNCVDAQSTSKKLCMDRGLSSSAFSERNSLKVMRITAVTLAATVAIWQEQVEYLFTPVQLSVLMAGMALLSGILWQFCRGPGRYQPSAVVAVILRFAGRHTLEIYAIQLAFSEVFVNLFPALAA